jgi:hypothetical protein
MFSIPQMNDMIPVGDLQALNESLRKAATGDVGYQTVAGTSGTGIGGLSALVPQSIEGTLASATYTMKELALWPSIPKRAVGQTVHEFSVINDHGLDMDPFISEGAGGANNKSSYTRKFIKIKYLAERREVTDVATMVGLIGNNSNALAEETERGTLRLMQKVEQQLWHGDESTTADTHFDGVIKQITDGAPKNVTDLRGQPITPNLLQEVLGDLYAAPKFGRPDKIWIEPRVHADLIKQSVVYGRHDQLQSTDGALTFGHRDLNIMAPYGSVPLAAAPFLFEASTPPNDGDSHAGDASAAGTAPVTPTVTNSSNTSNALSQFTAADVGFYGYKFVRYNDSGFSAAGATVSGSALIDHGQVANSGESVTVQTSAAADWNYMKVYRSAKAVSEAAVDMTTCKFIGQIKRTDAAVIDFVDHNDSIPGTSKIVLMQMVPEIVEFARLLDFLRRPLAEVATTKPFLLMLMGSPIVKVATKCAVITNVGLST